MCSGRAALDRTVPYRTVPYRTVPYRTVPYRTVPVANNSFHNIVAVQRGGTYDLRKDTMQWSYPNIFPVPAGMLTVWPSGGIFVNKQTIIVAAQAVTPTHTYPS